MGKPKIKRKGILTPQKKLHSNFEAKKSFFEAYMRSGGNSCKKGVPVHNLICRQSNQFVVTAKGLSSANQEARNRLVLGTLDTGQERRRSIGQMEGPGKETSQWEEVSLKPSDERQRASDLVI